MSREWNATFPCGRNVNVWKDCRDCPDYPCNYVSNDEQKEKI